MPWECGKRVYEGRQDLRGAGQNTHQGIIDVQLVRQHAHAEDHADETREHGIGREEAELHLRPIEAESGEQIRHSHLTVQRTNDYHHHDHQQDDPFAALVLALLEGHSEGLDHVISVEEVRQQALLLPGSLLRSGHWLLQKEESVDEGYHVEGGRDREYAIESNLPGKEFGI